MSDIVRAIGDVAVQEPDFLIFGSSSFLMANVAYYTELAVAFGVPVFSAAERVLTDGSGLLGLISSLNNIGQVSGYQAVRILRDGVRPGDLPTTELTRFSLMINIPVARQLNFYPPMLVLQFAELLTD